MSCVVIYLFSLYVWVCFVRACVFVCVSVCTHHEGDKRLVSIFVQCTDPQQSSKQERRKCLLTTNIVASTPLCRVYRRTDGLDQTTSTSRTGSLSVQDRGVGVGLGATRVLGAHQVQVLELPGERGGGQSRDQRLGHDGRRREGGVRGRLPHQRQRRVVVVVMVMVGRRWRWRWWW